MLKATAGDVGHPGVAQLRVAVFTCLFAVGVGGLCLASLAGIRLNTPVISSTFYHFVGMLSASALLWSMATYVPEHFASERSRRTCRYVADLLALTSIRYLFPLVMTVASYGLVPHTMPLVDEWLSWPERMLDLTHPAVYRACESWGLLFPMALLYDSLWLHVWVMLGWFGLVRRNVVPLWEVAAAVSIATTAGLVVFWLAPAIGPWSYYGYAAPPDPPAFLADFLALREGRFTALEAGEGLVTVPSFHVVFAILFTWVFRRERRIYPFVVAWCIGVVAVTFPVGWHYLADLPAGGLWAVGAIAVVRRLQGLRARHASLAPRIAITPTAAGLQPSRDGVPYGAHEWAASGPRIEREFAP